MSAVCILVAVATLVAQTPVQDSPAPRGQTEPGGGVSAPGGFLSASDGGGDLPDLTPAERFDRGRIAFGRGEHARAIEILLPLLYPSILLRSESEVVQGHRMLAVAYLYENQPDQAREEFIRLLELRPDYRFDPLLDPPFVVDFFNQILREREAQIAALAARRQEAQRAEEERQRRVLELSRPRIIERRFVRNSYLINFIPFGTGQFQNGHRGKGWAFLVSESFLAATSVAAFTTNFALFGVRPRRKCLDTLAANEPCNPSRYDTRNEDVSARLRNVALISGGLFYAVAAWGIVDALIHHRPLTSLPPVESNPRPALETPQISLVPLIFEDGPGAALDLRF